MKITRKLWFGAKDKTKVKFCYIVMSVFPSLDTKIKKCIEGTLYEENEHYQKRVLWVFLKFQGRKTWKEHERHPIWEKKILQKKCLFSVFQLPTYQSSITHAKHQSWRNRTALRKKNVFWVFFFFFYFVTCCYYVLKPQNAYQTVYMV